ncbi:MAG: plasminogen activator [Arcobacteraceae bacterium]
MKHILSFCFLFSTLYSHEIVKGQISLTSLDTTSHEFVYNNGKKLSELIWEAKDVQMLGVQVDYVLSPSSFIKIGYKTNLSDDALMDDYDWMKDDTEDWSHWSNHPNTKLDNFTILDISLNKKIKLHHSLDSNIRIGYKEENRKFKAYGGTYIYSSSTGFRDDSGAFNGLGISYEETFKTIYVGINGKLHYSDFTISGGLSYSPMVQASNIDTHHMRYFTNNNTFNDTTMIAINAEVEYLVTKRISIALNYTDIQYSETQGITTRTYYEDGTDSDGNTIPSGTIWKYGGAGISNSYSSLSLMMIAKF